jgi:hypothetical protein
MDHPDLAGMASEMRAEWRAEQAAAAEDAAAQWRHGRVLNDWLTERMHGGDRLAVSVADQRFVGVVEELGPDLIGLRCALGRVDVHVGAEFALSIEVEDKAHRGGVRGRTGRTFYDALYARDGRTDMSVGTMHHPEGIDGTLLVGKDFVSIVTRPGAETVVPIDCVAWVSARHT